MEQIYALFWSFTLFVLDSWIFNLIYSSSMELFKNIQEFSRRPENTQGQQDVFQESRTKRVLIANSRIILGAKGRLATLGKVVTTYILLHEANVAVTLARQLHVSKVGQSKQKGKTKQATLISDFHAHGSNNSLWPIRLGEHRWRHNPSFPRFEDQTHTEGVRAQRVAHASQNRHYYFDISYLEVIRVQTGVGDNASKFLSLLSTRSSGK